MLYGDRYQQHYYTYIKIIKKYPGIVASENPEKFKRFCVEED
jgi:hypothetical protein